MQALVAVLLLIALASAVAACSAAPAAPASQRPFTVVLGVAQDGGYPQAGCSGPCCEAAWGDAGRRRLVACLAIVDPASGERWLVDATPDLREQLRRLDELAPPAASPDLAGVLLTHAHIGHYTGLMFLGRESIGARAMPVHAMPRLTGFLAANGPWDQLVELGNVELVPLAADQPLALNERLTVTPFAVPHRDEYSETVGFLIEGPERAVAYLPDIDQWSRWERPLEELLGACDRAYLDGTFFDDGELPGRDMSKIPHPRIAETLERLATLPAGERAEVRFIHLNHTNPALDPQSGAARAIAEGGCSVARELERFEL